MLAALVAAGYRRIKCKIEPGRDVGVLRTARETIGPDVLLAADANGRYPLDGARRLFAAIDELALQCVEQPAAPEAIADHATWRARAHSHLPQRDDHGRRRRGRRDCPRRVRVISVKVGRLGSRTPGACTTNVCAPSVGALPEGVLETGMGRAALLAVAALPDSR